MLTCQLASPQEFIPICNLFQASKIGGDISEVRRRITIPLLLQQLITFYKNGKICGFVTFAFLNEESEKHMATVGILPNDWRSGSNFWAIDFVALHSGYEMLRLVTKKLGVKTCKYFREKQQRVKEVRRIA